ncbi:MAG: excinuclease ABC subunit C [Dehalococcoidia bacterium SG8_51_3]|nr:MAG: excinuclease ABC subunit C [Dehalococcoidia bacterium SG8_51_3]
MISNLITEQLRQLPTSPGVYLMRDTDGGILYIGKAANLHHRVRSYFSAVQKLSPKLKRMVARVNDFDFFVTTSEQEALILELNLIKRHRPSYNVQLKDDKTFPYLKINTSEDWPRVHITRRLEEDGARYFGPFASGKSIRQTLKTIRGIFPFRSCSKAITGTDLSPCLEYHIGHCLAPCIGAVSKSEYDVVIKQVILFLEGKQEKVIQELESKMKKAAEALDFEKAALIRDQIQAVNRVIEGQRIATTVRGEQDVIAFAQDKDQAYVQVFFIRSSKLIGRESFILQGARSEEPSPIMTSFIKQFYNSTPYIPPLLLLQYPVEDTKIIESWLQSKKGAKVNIQVPRQGNKNQLVKIVAENAEQGLEQLKIKQLATPGSLTAALAEIEKELHLPCTPLRMEGYDISNIQGKAAVGSMVVFDKGKPKPSHYRRFRIKTVSGADDYAMLHEVLKRRFKQSRDASDTWAILPDLILIDGGKGQLNAALSAMSEAGVNSVPTASLAKENEEIFIPASSLPIILPRSSQGLQLLQRLRDEAHRFALGYHQKIHKRETFASSLDNIPGIGPKRKRALLKQFGSLRAIREAPIEELAVTAGMSRSLAIRIKEHL